MEAFRFSVDYIHNDEAHRSLERYQTRGLREKETESLEKRSVSVVVTKDGVEPLSHKELYKKKTAQHNERQRVGGGEESSEAVAKNSTLGAKLKLKPRTWLC